MLSITMLMTFSACNIFGSSDSDELLLSIEGHSFEVDDTVTVQINNYYDHDIFVHIQTNWWLQQKIDSEWKTIYMQYSNWGPPRFSLFIEAGEMKPLKYPALPSSALFESGYNEFRYGFALFHEPDISSPLPEKHRYTSSFIVSID